jgi:hypothetical protein
MTSTKPSIVIVPGGWHIPEHFAPTTKLLEEAGYVVYGVRLPSVRDEPPFPTTHEPDTEAVRNVLLRVLDEDKKDVLLVMHSYGGIPGGDACKGLSKEDPTKEGKTTAVIQLVWIAAFAVQEGESLEDARQNPLPETGGNRRLPPHNEAGVGNDSLCWPEDDSVCEGPMRGTVLTWTQIGWFSSSTRTHHSDAVP